MLFRWNAWNIDHIERHSVDPNEAEYIAQRARRPYPRQLGNGKYLVRGQTVNGKYLQVIYVFDPEDACFVIHARPLTDNEKRRYRREQP